MEFLVHDKGTILRAGADLKSDKIREVAGGTLVKVSQEVTLDDGKIRCKLVFPEGWVTKKTLITAPPSPQKAVEEKKSPTDRAVTKEDGETWLNGRAYGTVACKLGIPSRPHGLIEDDDPLWLKLQTEARPFVKHGWDQSNRRLVPTLDSWIVGDSACEERGFDLRYALPIEGHGLVGIVKFSNKARIMGSVSDEIGFQIVHGGAVMSVMDEFMAENMKAQVQPNELTISFEAQLKKATVPGITYWLESVCKGQGRFRFTKCFEMKIKEQDGAIVALGKSEQIDLVDQKCGQYENPYDGP